MKLYKRSRQVITSPGLIGITELPSGTSAASAGMVTFSSSPMPLSMPRISVMILVVLAGNMRTLLFLLISTSPVSRSTSSADSANKCPVSRYPGLFTS